MTFSALGLTADLESAAHALGLSQPTEVQAQAIPAVLRGTDVFALAPTGSGKTAAFVLPLLQRLRAEPAQAPRRVRVALLNGAEFHPGDWLSLTARLDAPAPPVAPGAGDFGRWLYFQSIGATGFSYGRARAIPPARDATLPERLSQRIEDLRVRMTVRIHAGLPGSAGGIADRGDAADAQRRARNTSPRLRPCSGSLLTARGR